MVDRTTAVGWFVRLSAMLALAAQPTLAATVHLGVLGDSNSDEYRADDNRGGSYAGVTFNWVELLQKLRGVDVGPWGTRAEPRRTGYEFNWARSGAKAADLASQQDGLAQQVAAGQVQYVVIHIGVNDFHAGSTYDEIYSGALAGAALQQKVNGIIAAIRSAIRAVTQAGGKVVVTSIPDIGISPAYQVLYPDASRRAVVSNAIGTIDTALENDAIADPNVAFVDLTAFFLTLAPRIDAQGNLSVGGEKITLVTSGNEPHHFQLGDASAHPGTISSALMASGVVAATLNREFGTDIPLLGDQEILCVAGINTAANCASRPKPPVLSILD